MRRMMTMWLAAGVLLAGATTTAAGEWWIPASAHGPGADGSVWRTDLVLANFGDGGVEVTISLMPQGTDNGVPTLVESVMVAAGATIEIADVVAALFGAEGTAAIRIAAPGDHLVATSRTYNLSPHGTFGQSISGVAAAAAIPAGSAGTLIGLSSSEGRRTNLGWVNAEARPVTVTVFLYDAAGDLINAATFDALPYGQTQFNLFRELGAGAVASARAIVTADGALVPYASVVAAGSNDPIYVPALRGLDAATDLLYPAVAHVAGSGGTSWGTDAWLLNIGGGYAEIALELWPTGGGAPLTTILGHELAPGEQVALEDLVRSTFGLDGTQGALAVHADQLLLATSRTYNNAPVGEFGQFIPARSIGEMAGVGERQVLPGAVQSSAFRSNLGLVAVGGRAEAELTLRGADGGVLATATRSLAAGEQIQDRVANFFGIGSFDGATVEVVPGVGSDPAARVVGYLSVVDNLSTDPTFASAARGFGADPGSDGISQMVLAATYALAWTVDNAGPQAVKQSIDCLDVSYNGDTVRPGQSPEGACWQAAITFDDCGVELPIAGWGLSQDGSAAVDVCIIDGYPSSLTTDLTTEIIDLANAEVFSYSLESALGLTLSFSGSLPSSARLTGDVTIIANGARVDAWADLEWEGAILGFELIPVGRLKLELPYETDISATAAVMATFDGSEWVLVEVRLGYFNASFLLNIFTGQVVPT